MNSKAPIIPTFTDALDNFRKYLGYNLYCHLPGTIVSYNRTTQRAVINIAMQKVIPNFELPAAAYTIPYPQLSDVPVFFPQADSVSVGGDPVAGDPCLLCILDRNMDAWKQDATSQAPLSDRAHNISDCFAIVGFNPLSTPLASARVEGDFGIAEPLAGTGAKIVVNGGFVTIANNTANLALILTTLLTAIGAATTVADIAAAATTANASLALLLQ